MSDYSDIQQELDDFENAVYGEEVRDSMISAIKKIYDIAESAAGAPDASTATAGQVLTADGNGGHYWGNIEAGGSVPTNVRQAILALFQNGVYTRDDMSDEVAVIQSWATEITSISVNPTTLQINGMNQETIVATTTPAGGAVTWSSSDESIAAVSGGVVTPTGINGTCTITASCGGKSATCTVTVTGFATLTGISAVYTQSGTVYDTDTLDSLRDDLVVTASYDNGTTQTVTSYTLSGTLAVGTSTITVSYGGYSDTFNVTVPAVPINYIYNWDFTASLTDTVAGNVATLHGSAAQTANGITFTTINDYVSFGTNLVPSSSFSRTVEVDIFEQDKQSGSNARVFANNPGEGLVYRGANSEWGLYSSAGGWTMLGITDANYFSGKTVSFELSNGSFIVSCDGATLGSISIADYRFTLGSSVTSFYNMTISGLRVY